MAGTTKKLDKKAWVNIAAGTIAVIAIMFGVKECGDKRDAVRETEDLKKSVLVEVRDGVNDLRKDAKDIKGLIITHDYDVKDLIVTHDRVVNEKLDTLKAHCDKQKPCDCKPVNNNRKPTKPARSTKPVTTVVAQPAARVTDTKTAVEVVAGQNKVVVKDDTVKPNQAVIVNGENSGTIIVNANGIVSGNAIVNGDNNTVVNGNNNKVNVDKVAEARKKYLESCAQKKVVVLGERVQCR